MKKIFKNIFLILFFVLILIPTKTFANSDIELFVNGKFVESDVEPTIENGRTLVPVRIISETLGYKVTWNERSQSVKISGNNKNILMPINSKSAKVNNQKIELDVAAKIINNRTFVPVRFIAENLGTTVDWDTENRVVIIGNGYDKIKGFKKVKVTRVVDGDTIIVNYNGKDEKLRMILVDTPETVHPRKPVECFGKEASNYTKKSLSNKYVYLQKDVSDRDRYGRLLRYVWTKRPNSNEPTKEEIEKYMFNAILTKEGYGKIATFPPDVKYVEIFRELDQSARKNNKGLWNCSNNKKEVKDTNKSKTKPKNNSKIKGNKNSKIYHLPTGANYNKLSEKNIVYFNSEEDAIKAGYRKSKN